MQGGSGLARHWFHGRFQASALPLVRLWAVLRSERLPEGPGSLARHWFRGRFQAAFWAPFLTPYPGGQGQPRFRREQRAGWADAPLPGPAVQGAPILPGGQWRPGLRREQRAGRTDTPRWKAVALHGGPGGSPAALCHFLSAEKVKPGLPVRPEYYSNESPAQRQSLATFF